MQINVQSRNFTRFEVQGNVIGQDALVLKTMLDQHIQVLEKQESTPLLVFDMANAKNNG